MLNKFLSEGTAKIKGEVSVHYILWISGYMIIKVAESLIFNTALLL